MMRSQDASWPKWRKSRCDTSKAARSLTPYTQWPISSARPRRKTACARSSRRPRAPLYRPTPRRGRSAPSSKTPSAQPHHLLSSLFSSSSSSTLKSCVSSSSSSSSLHKVNQLLIKTTPHNLISYISISISISLFCCLLFYYFYSFYSTVNFFIIIYIYEVVSISPFFYSMNLYFQFRHTHTNIKIT